ncbi:TetR/AcrR family transcriptional regulator [Granulicoccus sp. GXG6511]|uniref:TetR/AcrR family transcriptional regulator n=1 Tax=Granulicoccus sp. GXG6511 TaxID=3381351 RepID=UPI003D7D8060
MPDPEPAADHPRDTYHHGQLGPALVEAGLALARVGGPEAIVIREVTRRAGVTPRAAYRHFQSREALVQAVAEAAHARLADVITRHVHEITTEDPTERARGLLRAVGRGYIEFALSEPGWFEVAFFVLRDLERAEALEAAGEEGRTPYQLLGDALDALVETGELAEDERFGADLFCWSTVHGYAVLATKGPLRDLPPGMVTNMAEFVVDAALRGVVSRAAGD